MIKLRYFIGNDDRLINLIEIKDFFSRVPTEDEELVEIQNGLHEVFNDLDREKAYEKTVKWILKH